MHCILDASAILAHLQGEPGQDAVARAIAADAGVCTANLAEVAGRLARNGVPAELVRRVVATLPVTPIDLDLDLALRAGLLEAPTRGQGLSLGDRVCLALAQREGLPALTADRAWRDIGQAIGVSVTLIR